MLFYTLKPSGEHDIFSMHGSCPTKDGGGRKWIAQQWIHNMEQEISDNHYVFANVPLMKLKQVNGEEVTEDMKQGALVSGLVGVVACALVLVLLVCP